MLKRYGIGIFAIMFAIAAVAFTKSPAPAKGDLPSYFFEYDAAGL
jgi:hypothetical protein